jgi:prophage antirepressor-like protein
MVASSQDPSRNRGLERFTNSEFAVELLPHGDSFKVVASGVAHALGFYSAKDMLRTVPDAEKGWELAPTPGGDQQVHVLLEPGFYRVIGQRQAARVKDLAVRDQVERFQSWVYGEVLPSIRKQGAAAPALPQDYEEALVHLLDKVRENKQLESKVRELEPAAQSWNVLATADGDLAVADAAKILARDPRIETGPRRLFNLLITMRWAYRQQADNRPRAMQYAVERGWLSELPQSHSHPESGELVLDPPQVRVTVKGMHELHKRLGGEGPLQLSA